MNKLWALLAGSKTYMVAGSFILTKLAWVLGQNMSAGQFIDSPEFQEIFQAAIAMTFRNAIKK